jgi:hypothetical protein
MDYEPQTGDWILYSSQYGLKIGVVRYLKKAKDFSKTGPTQNVDVCYTDDDRVCVSEILEVRCADKPTLGGNK